jgi:hypothetical protein
MGVQVLTGKGSRGSERRSEQIGPNEIMTTCLGVQDACVASGRREKRAATGVSVSRVMLMGLCACERSGATHKSWTWTKGGVLARTAKRVRANPGSSREGNHHVLSMTMCDVVSWVGWRRQLGVGSRWACIGADRCMCPMSLRLISSLKAPVSMPVSSSLQSVVRYK